MARQGRLRKPQITGARMDDTLSEPAHKKCLTESLLHECHDDLG